MSGEAIWSSGARVAGEPLSVGAANQTQTLCESGVRSLLCTVSSFCCYRIVRGADIPGYSLWSRHSWVQSCPFPPTPQLLPSTSPSQLHAYESK